MLETTKEAARNVGVGARSMVSGARPARPFRAAGSRTPDAATRTHVLPSYPSRAALEAAARRRAILARGQERFIVESRVLAIGLPLGIALGALAWRGRSPAAIRVARFASAFAAAIGLTLLEAAAEWRGMQAVEER